MLPLARSYRIWKVWGDNYAGDFAKEPFRNIGLQYKLCPSTPPTSTEIRMLPLLTQTRICCRATRGPSIKYAAWNVQHNVLVVTALLCCRCRRPDRCHSSHSMCTGLRSAVWMRTEPHAQCVIDRRQPGDSAGKTLQQLQRDHASVMDRVYREHEAWLQDQWRTK